MSGHSHAANIKHHKDRVDKKRAKIFAKHTKAIGVAARESGIGDPSMNAKLKLAVDKARADNMPKDNIERAIKKGLGETSGEASLELTYEGYGAGGTAILVEAITDNRTRTAAEVRNIFERAGGTLGTTGCVSFIFEKKGLIVIEGSKTNEEQLMEIGLEAGAEDIKQNDDGSWQLLTAPVDFAKVKDALEKAGIQPDIAEFTQLPNNFMELSVEDAKKVMRLIENLEDNDDVQNVYSNAQYPDDVTVN